MTAVEVTQAPPTLLPASQPAPAPPSATDGGAGPAPEASGEAKFSEAWVRAAITYVCHGLAEEFGPEWKVTALELTLLTAPMTALLNQHAPQILVPQPGSDTRPTVVFLAGVLLFMAGRRALALRRRQRTEAAKKGTTPPPPQPAAAAASLTPNGGRFGDGHTLAR